jgi:hemoglobin-like flavoprotein
MGFNAQMIQTSFEDIKPFAHILVDNMITALFADYPDARDLMKELDIKQRIPDLAGSVLFIVDSLENPNVVKAYLEKVAPTHAKLGIQTEQYKWVGEAMIKTLSVLLREKWTQDLQQQWIMAFNFVAMTLIEGAKGSTATPSPAASSESLVQSQVVQKTTQTPPPVVTLEQEQTSTETNPIRAQAKVAIQEVLSEILAHELENGFRDQARKLIRATLEKILEEEVNKAA